MLFDGNRHPAGHRRVPITHSQVKKKSMTKKQETNNKQEVAYGVHAAWWYGPGGRYHAVEKASKTLKRSDLYMNKIVSVIMSSLLMSLKALLPYKRRSVRWSFGRIVTSDFRISC